MIVRASIDFQVYYSIRTVTDAITLLQVTV